MGVIGFEMNGNSPWLYKWNSICSYRLLHSWKPFFGVDLKARNSRRTPVFHVQKLNYGPVNASLKNGSIDRSTGDGLLTKELEFRPSFDEYLKAMESARTIKRMNNDSSTKKHKLREMDMSRKSRLEGVEGNKKCEIFGGRMDEKNELEVAKEDQALKVAENVMNKGGSSKASDGFREKRTRGFKNVYDRRKSKTDIMIKQKHHAEIMKDMRLKHQSRSSEPESDDCSMIKSESTNMGNSITGSNRNGRCGSIIEEETFPDLHSLRVLGEMGVKDYNSVGKTPGKDKIVTRSHSAMHREHEKSYTKIQNFMNENGHENVKLNRSSQDFYRGDYFSDNLEVERAAFKTYDEFNDVMSKPPVSRREMEERIQKLAKLLNGADINIPEWVFSKMMRSAKIKFNDYSMVRLIQILGKLGNWQRVIQVIEWLQMRERFKSHKLRHIYTAALDALGKARRPVEALNIFLAMQQQMSSYPDLVAYRSIAVTLGQAGKMEELFDVIDIMRSPPKKKFKIGALGNWDPRLEPDIVVYNAVLNACVQQKQWEGAFWVLQQLKKQGEEPSATTYGLVMEVMFSCGKYNVVYEFFRKVQKSSIPNSLTYRVLVNTLWKEGKTDEAILAVQDMEGRGIVGSASLYYDLARCLCAAGRCHEALMQIEKICKVANKPLVVTYTGLIQACLDSGNALDGAYIFENMKEICCPNLVTCNIMLKAFVDYGMFQEAKQLFEKMSENANHLRSKSDYKIRVIPDICTFNTMLDACTSEIKWDYFEYVYEKMLHHGHYFNPKRHLQMILEASRAGKEGPLETTWEHLADTDRIPPALLIKERFCAKLAKGDHIAALTCITNNPSTEFQAFSKLSWLNLLKDNAHRFPKDTLVRLMNEVSILTCRRSNSPNPALENLKQSCKEFCLTGK
ncbi:hypothetical protein L6164_035308 [Bauhinia variegata]|uniref:Uncharacterized protein n=1 Tax=Bauhinia variegata TaxID=167791 RepID=A0ACB9KDG7_BAUVA|nr:hypothetical protein L6164_035308 [Bauhinia variegata]